MSKVKITQEQADAIEAVQGREKVRSMIIRWHTGRGRWVGDEESLNELELDELIRALYIGYEVEPEFKVWNWVTDPKGDVGKIGTVKGRMLHADWGSYRAWISKSKVVHSLPEEIAKEKERRWWAKHDRDVWEIKQGDVLMATRRHIFEVTADPRSHEFSCYTGNDEFDFDIEECQDENWKVICFRDDRKDV